MTRSRQKQSLAGLTKLWQPAGLSSHWTTAVADRWFLILLVALTLFHLAVSVSIAPTDDELYYWAWSQNLSSSYFDHPPMVAYLIAFSTKIFGDNLFGIRFFGCLIGTAILWMMGLLCRTKGLLLLVIFSPIFLYGTLIITPDIPLLLFWTAYVIWLAKLANRLEQWSLDPVARVYHKSALPLSLWALGGLVLALGLLSKYTMALAIPCALFALWSKYSWRAWGVGFVVHLVVAGLGLIPILLFNLKHEFAPLKFQWNHSMDSAGFSFKQLLEFTGTQILLVGALPFLMFPWVGLLRKQLQKLPTYYVCWCFYLPPLLFFLYRSLRVRMEANWALIAYIPFWILAQHLLERSSFRSFHRVVVTLCFIPALAVSVLLTVHRFYPLVRPSQDRLAQSEAKLAVLAQVVSDVRPQDVPIFTTTYQWVSQFRYHKLAAFQFPTVGRMSHFSLENKNPCEFDSVFVFYTDPVPAQILNCFPNQEQITTYEYRVRNELRGTFPLVKYTQ